MDKQPCKTARNADITTARDDDTDSEVLVARILKALEKLETPPVGPRPTKYMRRKVRMYGCALEAILIKYGFGETDCKIAHHIMRGLNYAQISEHIGLSESQVKKHAIHIFKRAEVTDRTMFERKVRWTLFFLEEHLEFLEPVGLTEGMEPMGPAEGMEPAGSAEARGPVRPTEGMEPMGPAEAMGPAETTSPVEPEEAVGPMDEPTQ